MVATGSDRQPITEPDPEAAGQRRRTGKGHVDSYGPGRVCEAAGCTTKLSRYNSSSACWVHDKTVVSASHWAHIRN